ncbi:MAG: class I SAM-dependent methyltransferase [Pseudorhodoplanes sp.]
MSSTRARYRRIAPLYDLLDLPFELMRYRPIRPLLFENLSGNLLDAGIGTGRNIPYYPPHSWVAGIDSSDAMLTRAAQRRPPGARVALAQSDVTQLPFADDTFDAAISTFLFCVLADELQAPALREIRRVVKPGGTIRLLEYSRPHSPLRRAIARLWEPWMHFAFGAGFDRRTERGLAEAGLALTRKHSLSGSILTLLEARVP